MKPKYDIIQKGDNPDFPKTAEIWTLSDPVPEWLIDRAKFLGFTEEGQPEIDIREESGGYFIPDSSGREVLVRLKGKDSFLLYSPTHPLISLTPHQMELLYEFDFR